MVRGSKREAKRKGCDQRIVIRWAEVISASMFTNFLHDFTNFRYKLLMPNPNAEKGHALEQSVKIIQESILESDPKLKGVEFSIETNKIVVKEGVRHEIDVLVKTLPGSRYESINIFECKNWKTPVGKNEVVILADKVNALEATRGWLVARSITRDAEARLKQDGRLKFIRCTDDFVGPFDGVSVMHSIRDVLPIDVRMKQRGVPAKDHPDRLDWKKCSLKVNGKSIVFLEFIKAQIDRAFASDTKERAIHYQHEGTHWSERAEMISFEVGEFLVDGSDTEYLVVVVRSFVTIRGRKILSKFELTEHGRVFRFEPLEDSSGKSIEINLVQRF